MCFILYLFHLERGQNPFDVLPEGWVVVSHKSGMPIYLHKHLRVCSVSRPYFLGPGSVRVCIIKRFINFHLFVFYMLFCVLIITMSFVYYCSLRVYLRLFLSLFRDVILISNVSVLRRF